MSVIVKNALDHFIPHERNDHRPHVLRNKALVVFSVAIGVVKLLVIALTSFGAVDSAYSSAITKQNITNLTNESRKVSGLKSLVYSSVLEQSAQMKAEDMAAKQYFAHDSPDGRVPWDFFRDAGYQYLAAGENLAIDFDQSEDVSKAWLASPGHRANILNKSFDEIGIGVAQGRYEGRDTLYVVQHFGRPLSTVSSVANDAQTREVRQSVTTNLQRSVPRQVQNVKAEQVTMLEDGAPKQEAMALTSKLLIEKYDIVPFEGRLKITATTTKDVVKLSVNGAGFNYDLLQTDAGIWTGMINPKDVDGKDLRLEAFGAPGVSVHLQLPNVNSNFEKQFDLFGLNDSKVILFGKLIDLKQIESRFYLILIAVLASLLMLAIGLKRHVQHMGMIANVCFVIILAAGMLMI